MSPKLPSLKRSLLISLLLVALLTSAVRLLDGDEIGFSSDAGITISSVLEEWGSWVYRFCSGLFWDGEPSSGRHLQPSSETGDPAIFEVEDSDQRSNLAISDATPSSKAAILQVLKLNSSVSPSLFRTWGTLTVHGGSALSYIIVNATLWNGDRPVEGARYMMMDVEPGSCCNFDIRKVCRLAPEENYSCLLEVEGPEGPLELEGVSGAERRGCEVVEDDPRLVIWDETAGRGQEATPENEPLDSLSTYGSGKTATSVSSPYKSTAVYQEVEEEVEDLSEDVESEEYDLSSDSDAFDQKDSVPEVETDNENPEIEVETDDEGHQAGDARYVGSSSSNKYHRLDCKWAKKIKPENRIYFTDVEEAEEKGYLPCKVCNPK